MVFVRTPAELKEAIEGGSPHIELRAHMDITTLTLPSGGFGTLPGTIQSIRVRTSALQNH